MKGEQRGQPPYHPRLMVKLLLYGYCLGVRSSRRIARRLVEDVAFRVLAAGNQPDFRTISDFRKIHLEALEGLFQQVLRVALESGAMKLGRVALDGTKMKANASKHKAMSYGRIQHSEPQLAAEVKQMLAEAEAVDAAEDARYGPRSRATNCPRSCNAGRRGWRRFAKPSRRWSNERSNGRNSKPPPRVAVTSWRGKPNRATKINTISPIRSRAL